MSLFSRHHSEQRIGAIVEVGSGSVVTAIAVSTPDQSHPEIVWARREFANLSHEIDAEHSIKSMLATIMDSVMLLESEGRRALEAAYHGARIDTFQVSISAPWSYTVSKVISYDRDEPFTITNDLIESLITKANEQTLTLLAQNEFNQSAGLNIMTRATTAVMANGYPTADPTGQKAVSLALTQVSAIGQGLITSAVDDLRVKLFPRATLERYSTMLVFYSLMREMYPTTTECCLVDLTYEATEIAIIRDGVLQYSTHTAIGLNTLVRNLALRLDRPQADAESLLKRIYNEDSLDSLSEQERTAVTNLFGEYQNALESLFHETGDSLSIPKVIFLHSSFVHERYYDNIVADAAKAATGSSHTVHTLTHDLMLEKYTGESKIKILQKNHDTATLMACQFFHKQGSDQDFTQM